MLEIELKKKFTKDLKKHILNQKIELEVFDLVVESLRNQIPLDKRFKDHALVGTYKGCRECHIKSDVLLVYRVKNNMSLVFKDFHKLAKTYIAHFLAPKFLYRFHVQVFKNLVLVFFFKLKPPFFCVFLALIRFFNQKPTNPSPKR
ncbi:addiction module toxin, RelE/StbE family [Helicobacter pylori GAM265BSii]|uniref:Addiction module toxin, RelE/StbE family n=1 Tax=Helicobacter pylori GAM265BSii TaxID=1159049 RepID=M3RES2_HELPX|nr:addiction module toxin, RelE/StbE family [Helicobacter pylori GAM265BSii]